MKKQNETKNANVETPAKPKRQMRAHRYFLYVPERGFICTSDTGLPTVGGSNPIHFSLRNKAKYAIEFFKTLKIADEIQLFMNVG